MVAEDPLFAPDDSNVYCDGKPLPGGIPRAGGCWADTSRAMAAGSTTRSGSCRGWMWRRGGGWRGAGRAMRLRCSACIWLRGMLGCGRCMGLSDGDARGRLAMGLCRQLKRLAVGHLGYRMLLGRRPAGGRGLQGQTGAREDGAPGGIRTPDQWLRKPLLYPAELRARCTAESETGAPNLRIVRSFSRSTNCWPSDCLTWSALIPVASDYACLSADLNTVS